LKTSVLASVRAFSGLIIATQLVQAAVPLPGVTRIPMSDRQDIRFLRLASRGETLNASVRAITQDKQGFIWFATNSGLFRYDGYTLRQYRHNADDRNTISSDDVRTLFKDRSGMLWIGTAAQGLDRFDPAHEVVTHYRHNSKDPNSLSSDNLICIYQDSSRVLWFGTSDGLDRLKPGETSFTRFGHDSNEPASLSANTILDIHEDRYGNLWVGTPHGLNRMDRTTGRSVRFVHNRSRSTAQPHNTLAGRSANCCRHPWRALRTHGTAAAAIAAVQHQQQTATAHTRSEMNPLRKNIAAQREDYFTVHTDGRSIRGHSVANVTGQHLQQY